MADTPDTDPWLRFGLALSALLDPFLGPSPARRALQQAIITEAMNAAERAREADARA